MRCKLEHPERLGEQREYLRWQRIDLIKYGAVGNDAVHLLATPLGDQRHNLMD